MIEQMNKLYLVMHKDEIDRTLDELQSLGVVHINTQSVENEELGSMLQMKKRLGEFLRHFKNKCPGTNHEPFSSEELSSILEQFETLANKTEEVKGQITKLHQERRSAEPWGEFDPDVIDHLQAEGVKVTPYILTRKQFESVDLSHVEHEVISTVGSASYIVVIEKKTPVDIGVDRASFPEKSYKTIGAMIANFEEEATKLLSQIGELKKHCPRVASNLRTLEASVQLKETELTVEEHHSVIASLIGWMPVAETEKVQAALDKKDGIFFEIDQTIDDEDISEVPIKLRNGPFAKLFEPITKLFALPSYAELDLTPFFAPFFLMFFGICLGDTGYGVLISVLTAIGIYKLPKARPVLILGFLLGLSTVLWGILSGTTFGVNVFETDVPALSSMAVFTSDHMFYLALMIGLVQIFFGMAIQCVNKAKTGGWVSSLSTVGWILLVFFLTVMYLSAQPASGDFKLGLAFIAFCKAIPSTLASFGAILGVILILFFNDMKANIGLRIGKGLWELYGITGVVGDLLSYIRLFALGVSSAILGTVINAIGAQFLAIDIPVLPYIIYFGFLVVGHIGNMLLASLGAFVHPLRLTFVEFYKNAGFEGGGREYKPLSK